MAEATASASGARVPDREPNRESIRESKRAKTAAEGSDGGGEAPVLVLDHEVGGASAVVGMMNPLHDPTLALETLRTAEPMGSGLYLDVAPVAPVAEAAEAAAAEGAVSRDDALMTIEGVEALPEAAGGAAAASA